MARSAGPGLVLTWPPDNNPLVVITGLSLALLLVSLRPEQSPYWSRLRHLRAVHPSHQVTNIKELIGDEFQEEMYIATFYNSFGVILDMTYYTSLYALHCSANIRWSPQTKYLINKHEQ